MSCVPNVIMCMHDYVHALYYVIMHYVHALYYVIMCMRYIMYYYEWLMMIKLQSKVAHIIVLEKGHVHTKAKPR